MKAKTFLELISLSTTIYTISKQTDLLEKIGDLTDQGKEKLNDFMKEKMVDEQGNEIEFVDKLVLKIQEAKKDLEEKIGEVVASFYEKINIVHTDQLKAMEERLDQLTKSLELAEARINHLESKEK
jgi:polyhydroxyalkanoate synthesis regulator phasin